MSLRVRHPAPFCGQPFGETYTTPKQYYPNGNLIRRGFLWDGSTFPQAATVFGDGTEHPIALTFEQMGRWYWKLDAWQMAMDFDSGTVDAGVPVAPLNHNSIAYTDPQDDFPMSSVPMINRVNGRSLQVIKGKDTDSDGPYSSEWNFNFGDVLIDFDATPNLYYPRITFEMYPSLAKGFGDPYQGTTSYSRKFLDPTLPSIALGVNISIQDGHGIPFLIALYKDDASTSGPIPAAIVTAAGAKPTGYRTTT